MERGGGGGGGGGGGSARRRSQYNPARVRGPYAHAKYLQVVEKEGEGAILWYRIAIAAGDRVDSALKDMACAMKQHHQAEEAVEAIHSLRHLCTSQAQGSLDNLLIDLYKTCGRFDDQIRLLQQKLRSIHLGCAFRGKATKTARSHGKKFRVTVEQETARVLGNLGWAYMQKEKFDAAIVAYREAQLVAPDATRACNLGLCLWKMGEFEGARRALEDVVHRRVVNCGSGSDEAAVNRAEQLMGEMMEEEEEEEEVGMMRSLEEIMEGTGWATLRSRRLPVFEEISSF